MNKTELSTLFFRCRKRQLSPGSKTQCDLEMKWPLHTVSDGSHVGELLLIILNLLPVKYVKVRSISSGLALINLSDSIIRAT